MEKSVVRNAALAAVVVAGLGFGGLTAAMNANAAEGSAKADKDAAATTSAKADSAASSKDASAASDKAATGAYKDGTYTDSEKGIGGDVPVTVTISGGVITDVTVGDNNETQGVGSKAIDQLPSEIVAANGTDGVDGVSGASVTSKAIFTAVENCLEQAQ